MPSSALIDPAPPLPLFQSRAATPPKTLRSHRERLGFLAKSRGLSAASDSDLLELLLYRAVPRQDVSALANALLARFDGFAGVLSAPASELMEVGGVGAAVVTELKLVEASAGRLARGKLKARPILSTGKALRDYCRTAFASLRIEELRVLFLDKRNQLIADEVLSSGTVDHVAIYPREVVKRALELDATAIILAHNHPSGDPSPSKSDISATQDVAAAAAIFGIILHDHVIFGADTQVSFRAEQLL